MKGTAQFYFFCRALLFTVVHCAKCDVLTVRVTEL